MNKKTTKKGSDETVKKLKAAQKSFLRESVKEKRFSSFVTSEFKRDLEENKKNK